jgi:hypothetical protein
VKNRPSRYRQLVHRLDFLNVNPTRFDPTGSSFGRNRLVNTLDIFIAFVLFLSEDYPVGSKDVEGTDTHGLTKFKTYSILGTFHPVIGHEGP